MCVNYCLSAVSVLINTKEVSEKTEYKEEFFELKEQLTSKDSVTARENEKTSLAGGMLAFYKEKTKRCSAAKSRAS